MKCAEAFQLFVYCCVRRIVQREKREERADMFPVAVTAFPDRAVAHQVGEADVAEPEEILFAGEVVQLQQRFG